MRNRNFTFTNFDLKLLWDEIPGLRYVAYGVEQCPTTGREHQQGYCSFSSAVTLKTARARLGNCHVEVMRGTADHNEAYCSKESALVEWGTKPPGPGHRSDLAVYMGHVAEGKTEYALGVEFPTIWAQYGRRGEEYRRLLALGDGIVTEPRSWDTEVRVWWGPTGTGKTLAALAWLGDAVDDVSFSLSGFVVGYHGRASVLWDDWEAGIIGRGMFLRLTDRYPLVVNVKFGEKQWNPRKIAITSNYAPEEWYPGSAAVRRRIQEVTHCTEVVHG